MDLDYHHYIKQLKKLRDGLTNCISCGCISINKCPLRNRENRITRLGPSHRG